MCCYSRPWTVTAFWFSVPERLSNHPSAELSFLNSFSPDANTLSSVFRIIYCMIWKSFHRRQISNGNLWCCFTFCYVLFFLIFLFIWSHFVVFQLLLLPFVFVSHPFWIPTVFNHAVSSGSLFATLLLSGAKHSSLFVCVVRFLIRFCVCDFYFDF